MSSGGRFLYDVHFHPQQDLAGLKAVTEHPSLALANGTGPDDWQLVAEICRQYDWICPAFGLHPQAAAAAPPDWQYSLRRFLDEAGVVGVGEIGLDRSLPDSTYPIQRDVFEWQWLLAHERDLPVMLHCVKAWGMLKESLQYLPKLKRGFLMHGYSGSAEMVEELAKMGAWFSFSATIMHPNRKKQQEALQKVPLNRLLIESDGAVNGEYLEELAQTYHEISRQKGIAEHEFWKIIEVNWRKFVG